MRSLLKPSRRQTVMKAGAPAGMTAGAFLAGATLIALWIACAAGCSKSGATGAGALSFAQAQNGELTIAPIPFGEVNGREEYNASDIIPLADSRFLFCDNNTDDALFELDLTPDGRKKGPLIRRPLRGLAAGAAHDVEDMALVEEGGRRYVFLSSSMRVRSAPASSKDDSLVVPPGGVLRVTINPDETLVAEGMPDFRDWLIRAYPQLAASARIKPNDGGLNIEGLAWDGNRRALLFGLRTPTPGGKPMILPVKLKDLAGPWTTSNLEAQTPIHLSIEPAGDDQGIRCLYNEPGRDGFLVIVGKTTKDSEAPYSLYEWDGNAAGAVRRLNVVFARKMKPEGITRGSIGGRKALVIVDDGGGFQVIWDDNRLPYAGVY
ncbi:MAG TPA: DUF3616 domain-containing protein [Blastocatellia bacterium]|nr:DUF3616 domain-containing protein [Blastocatellia bacterium]